MKKITTLFAAAFIAASMFSFVSCDKEGVSSSSSSLTSGEGNSGVSSSSSSVTSGEGDSIENMTETEWNAIIDNVNFNNVTFTIWAQDVSGELGLSVEGEQIGIFKIVDNEGWANVGGQDVWVSGEMYDAIKSLYLQTGTAILKNFEDFEYNTTEKVFKSKQGETIEYEVNGGQMHGVNTVTNVVVEISEDGMLAEIACDMHQAETGSSFTCDLKVVFTYSDYGTTVLPTA